MAIIGKDAATTRAFLPAPLDSLGACELELDLYIRSSPTAPPSLYRSSDVMFEDKDRLRLIEQGMEYLYVPVGQHAALQGMMTARITDLLQDHKLGNIQRRTVISGICNRLIEDAMTSATGEALDSLMNVGSTIATIAAEQGDEVFTCLLDMSGHDFYTATHMMNVAIGCGLLANVVYAGDPKMVSTLVRAGLVHDLGKSSVPAELLNKEGKLTDEEFATIKAHPLEGVRLLREADRDEAVLVEVTRDHHEHLAGTGYPRRVTAEKISTPARIAAVVDVYDALTSARPYRGPIAWDQALQMMEESRESQFDPGVLEAWTRVVTEAAKTHQDELPHPTQTPCNIDDAMPHSAAQREAIDQAKAKLGLQTRFLGDNRRAADRVPCKIRGAFTPARADQAVDAIILDISKAGIRFASSEQLPKQCTGRLRATIASKRSIDRDVRIVRVSDQRNDNGLWEHGCVWMT